MTRPIESSTSRELPVIRTPTDSGPNAYVELVMHQCKECTGTGPWTQTLRNGDRATQYDMWDVEHSAATGHKKFFQFQLSRSNARIM